MRKLLSVSKCKLKTRQGTGTPIELVQLYFRFILISGFQAIKFIMLFFASRVFFLSITNTFFALIAG